MTYSFDIFDTLLLRPYAHPQEVWRVLEEETAMHGFAKARKKADALTYRLSTQENRETTIEEAYDIMPPKFRPLMQKEIDLELRVLRANPEMLRRWKELGDNGERRIIVSDMYLSADVIQKALRENGFDGWDGFYLSRDYNARKTTGELFKIMLQKEGLQPCDVLHIGDNKHSDVDMPLSLGMHAEYYPKVIDRLYESFPFTRSVKGRVSGALSIGWHQYCLKHPNATYWNKLGFMMGGVLGYIYLKWIVETARQQGINHLMFVARDGYVWKKMCEELYPNMCTDYFYAPRLTSIAVLGATGSDPRAIADRQRYIDTHLKGVDLDAIKRQYQTYLSQFVFDEHTAMVDGCSSGFSAQRLVESALGKNVFSFYLLSMAKMHNAGALYSTHLHSLPFQMLSEFLFGSPERPIRGTTDNGPIYSETLSDEEAFKISVSDELAEGAVACAKSLHELKVDLSPADWLSYCDIFMKNLTDGDQIYLAKAQNAGDVEQKNFVGLTYVTPKNGFEFRKHKTFGFDISFRSGYRCHYILSFGGNGIKLINRSCGERKVRDNG